MSALGDGWDFSDGYAYSEKQAEAVAREVRKLAERLEKSAALVKQK